MKKLLLVLLLGIIIGTLSACTTSYSDEYQSNWLDSKTTSTNSSTKTQSEDITYTATCHYTMNDYEVSSNTFTIKRSELTEENLKKKLSIPDEYELLKTDLNNCLTSEFDEINKTINYYISLKGQYEGYIYINSTDASANKKLVPISILYVRPNENTYKTVTDYYGNPVTYKASNITKIKIKNCRTMSFMFTISDYSYSYFSSLSELDVSELKYVKDVPDNFFAYCENLHKVIWGEGFKYTNRIGSSFFAGTSLSSCKLDLSYVTSIGHSFLYNSLTDLDEDASITFYALTKSADCALYQYKMNSNTKVNIYFNKVLPTSQNSYWFLSDGTSGYSHIPQFIAQNSLSWKYRTQGTYRFYSNYPEQLQPFATDIAREGANITVSKG